MGYATLLDQSVFFSHGEGGSQPDEPRIGCVQPVGISALGIRLPVH